MYEVAVNKSFSSAHYLPQYRGNCESLHGHNWRVEATVLAGELDSSGMVIDFRRLKMIVGEVIRQLDHCCLNDLQYFKENPPSSERIARYIYDECEKKLPPGRKMGKVKVWETENSCSVYSVGNES